MQTVAYISTTTKNLLLREIGSLLLRKMNGILQIQNLFSLYSRVYFKLEQTLDSLI